MISIRFFSGKSTDLQLLKLYRAIFKARDNSKSSYIIYIDMAKAFDNMSHTLLLHKLLVWGRWLSGTTKS